MKPKLACLTIDMEPDYGDPEGRIRLLENPVYFDRYTNIINHHHAKVTMFTVTSLFERYSEQFEKLSKTISLEFAAHSHVHDPSNGATHDEAKNSARVIKGLNTNKPLGYRAPYGQITKDGLGYLLDNKFDYDSSVYTSFRPGEFGYSNLDKPNIPFKITRGDESLIEFPFTSLSRVRIVFGLSYVKLLGWGPYSTLWKSFGLPDIAVALSHPHDFYFHELAIFHPNGPEKIALSRNAKRAFDYYEKMIVALQESGYEFIFLSEAYQHYKDKSDLRVFPLESWK